MEILSNYKLKEGEFVFVKSKSGGENYVVFMKGKEFWRLGLKINHPENHLIVRRLKRDDAKKLLKNCLKKERDGLKSLVLANQNKKIFYDLFEDGKKDYKKLFGEDFR